jgi:UDP-N-acetylmuramoylalanine--D-glutamate ligase
LSSGPRVLVLGLGITGRAVATALAEQGADVVASDNGSVDEHVVSELVERGIEVEQRSHERARSSLDGFDFVVPSPGISPIRGFLAEILHGELPIVSELDLAMDMTEATIVAVTGTNGKTTVCRMVEAMTRQAGLDAHWCGNTQDPFVSAVRAHPEADVFVVEASSFRLAFCERFSPRVAVITNLAPDHLDWHGSFEHYRSSKARIAARQGAEDLFLYPQSQPELATLAPDPGPRKESFPLERADHTAIAGFSRHAPHFAVDASAAAAAARAIGVGAEAVRAALESFALDPHRLDAVGTLNGVRVFDDAVSANPHATIAALRSFDQPVVLIAGGQNKGLDLRPLATEAPRLRAVVVMGEASEEIVRAFANTDVPVKTVGSMGEAVSVALDAASPGDVVLLSPACASWDMFNGYADRGRAFREACVELGVTT